MAVTLSRLLTDILEACHNMDGDPSQKKQDFENLIKKNNAITVSNIVKVLNRKKKKYFLKKISSKILSMYIVHALLWLDMRRSAL